MPRYEHYKLDLPGEQIRCPFYQNKSVGTPDGSGNRFPYLSNPRRTASRVLTARLAFGSVCVAVICVMISLIMPADGWRSLFTIAGIASQWIDVSFIVKKRKNLPKNILWQVIIVTLIMSSWDFLTGFSGWSLNFVFPILCSCVLFAMTIVAKARRLDTQDYILYLVIDCVLGIACFILILTGVVRAVVPSATSFGASIVFLAFLLFFEGKALWTGIQRRFHLQSKNPHYGGLSL